MKVIVLSSPRMIFVVTMWWILMSHVIRDRLVYRTMGMIVAMGTVPLGMEIVAVMPIMIVVPTVS
jgi:hypothetical protein